MCSVTVTSWGKPAEDMDECFHLQCQPGGWDRTGCNVFMDGSRTLLDSEAPPWLEAEPSVYTMRSCGLMFSIFDKNKNKNSTSPYWDRQEVFDSGSSDP